jgi:signal transduction histidine kinase
MHDIVRQSSPDSLADSPRFSTLKKQLAHMLPDSLMFQAVTGLLGILAIISVVMFYGIDSFVSQQFDKLHKERITRQNSQIQQLIWDELATYEALAKLVVADSDLRQSAQYHMFLEGEVAPLRADLDRISKAFHLDWLAVWDASGRLVAASNESHAALSEGAPEKEQAGHKTWSSLAWINSKLWVVASTPILVGGETAGWVQLGRQTGARANTTILSDEYLTLHPVRADGPQPPSSIRIPVWSPSNDIRALDIMVADPAREILTRTKRLIALTLLVSGLLLAVAIAIYLRRLLTPVRQLTLAVGNLPSQIEKDQLNPLQIGGHGEVRHLVDAFNDMIHQLERLRRLEADMHAQEKLSAVGRVAMRVAHDLNNPMTVIKNTAHLLKPPLAQKPELLSEIDLILHYCIRCSSTIDNLLRFGKPAKLKIETIELGTCMFDYQKRRGHPGSESKINVILQPDGPYFIRGDRYQLEQMVENILDNAIEANGSQPVDVLIGAEADGRYFLRFTDYGKGFKRDEVDKAFELFFTTKKTGTGLGLSNARAIAQAHGGDIRVTDLENGGVTVWLKPGF